MGLENGVPENPTLLKQGKPSKVAYVGAGASYVRFYEETDPYKLMSPHMRKLVQAGKATMVDKETGETRLMEYEDLQAKYPPKIRVEITTPQRGQRKNVVIKDKNDFITRKYAKEWALFKEGKTPEDVGLPLMRWDDIDTDFAESLKVNQGIRTVEQLAEITDDVARTIKEGLKLRDKARAYVSEGASRSVLEHVNTKNDQLSAQIQAQNKQIEELKALILDSKGNPTKGSKK